jgi:quercetin dioxygenase-like cupin family protein
MAMTRAEFEAELRRDGYQEIRNGRMAAHTTNPEHAHDFDARVMVLDGEIAIACDGAEGIYRQGDIFAVSAGRPHAERCGPEGMQYLAGHCHYREPTG